MNTEADRSVRQPQAKEHLGAQKLGEAAAGAFRGGAALLTPCFQTLASRTMREEIHTSIHKFLYK